MIIDVFSWHARWYSYWLTHSRGVKPDYQESLCHYVQVLLFWAPLVWVAERSPTRLLRRLYGAVVTVYAVVAVVAIVALLIYEAIVNPIVLVIALGSVVGFVLAVTAVFVVLTVFEGRKLEVPGTVKLAVSYIAAKKRRICPFITFE